VALDRLAEIAAGGVALTTARWNRKCKRRYPMPRIPPEKP